MSTRSSRLPVSAVNALLVAVFLTVAVGTAAAGRWGQTVMFALMSLLGLAGALHARRQSAGDVTRVNAIEYRDERDRQIAREGFAVVGVVALVLSVVGFVAVSTLGDQQAWAPAAQGLVVGQLLVLAVVWALGNYVAARRR